MLSKNTMEEVMFSNSYFQALITGVQLGALIVTILNNSPVSLILFLFIPFIVCFIFDYYNNWWQ